MAKENGYSKEDLSKKLGGNLKALRTHMERINYYLAPPHKAAIYTPVRKIKRLILDYMEENGDDSEEIDMAYFGEAYSEFMTTIATIGPVMDGGSEKRDVREAYKEFVKSTRKIELSLKGYDVQEMGLAESGGGGMDEEDLLTILE